MSGRTAGYRTVPETSEVPTMTDIPTTPDPSQDDDREERIRRRAYELSQQEDAGTPEENWQRAERELTEREGDSLGLDG